MILHILITENSVDQAGAWGRLLRAAKKLLSKDKWVVLISLLWYWPFCASKIEWICRDWHWRCLSQSKSFRGRSKKKLGIISESVFHFVCCTIIFTFSLHIAISEQRNTRFNGTQPVLLALCLPFTCFDFFACFSWKLRSESKWN